MFQTFALDLAVLIFEAGLRLLYIGPPEPPTRFETGLKMSPLLYDIASISKLWSDVTL